MRVYDSTRRNLNTKKNLSHFHKKYLVYKDTIHTKEFLENHLVVMSAFRLYLKIFSIKLLITMTSTVVSS